MDDHTPATLEDVDGMIKFFEKDGLSGVRFCVIWESIKDLILRVQKLENNKLAQDHQNIIFTMTDQELDDFLYTNGFDRTPKNREFAIEAFKGWIEEYYSEGNLESGAEGFMTRILADRKKK